MQRILKAVFGNPWIVCLLTTLLSTTTVWLALNSAQRTWNRLAVGAIFGFAVGIIHVIEIEFQGGTALKRAIGGVIGLLTGCSFALLLYPNVTSYFIFAFAGAVLGATARDWSKHLNFF